MPNANSTSSPAAGIHGRPWAFGQSSDRKADLWHKGVAGEDITRHSTPQNAKKKAPDTSAVIDKAIKDARANKKSALGLSVQNESTSWKVAPQQKELRPDEDRVRDRRHVVRAYADVHAGDDFNISVGPELILKDEVHGEEAAKADQPDSVFGLGMKFQYDF